MAGLIEFFSRNKPKIWRYPLKNPDTLKNIQDAADGRPYAADAMKSQESNEAENNTDSKENMMSNPRFLQFSYDGEKGVSHTRTVITEDEFKKNRD